MTNADMLHDLYVGEQWLTDKVKTWKVKYFHALRVIRIGKNNNEVCDVWNDGQRLTKE